MCGIKPSWEPFAWVRGAIGRAVGALDWMGGDDSQGSRGVAPGWNRMPLRGACVGVGKLDKPTIASFPNLWKKRISLFAESKSLESEIKKQLKGLRYE
jgi:hypothetical protein